MTPSSVRTTFLSVLSEAKQNVASFVNRPGSDMTRNRYCTFFDTVLATMCFSMHRSNTELLDFFGIKCPHIPSKSAFTQQRRKFNSALFPHLLKSFNSKAPFKKTYKGFHLAAVDGTDINLPTDKNDTLYRVKQARSDNYYFQMHLNALYDICENRYISAVTQPRPLFNENAAFCELVDDCTMPENTIFIADRGYASMNSMAHLIENNRYFLIRAKSPSSPGSFLKNVIQADDESDNTVVFYITRSQKKLHCGHHTFVKKLHSKRKFDYIDPDDRSSVYQMAVRCTCIKLGDNSYEYLVSNLPRDLFSAVDLKHLYWKRWAVETSFRSLKYALSLSYLHSVNRDLIIQEVYAKMLLYNFTSLIHAYAQSSKEFLEMMKEHKHKKHKHKYKVSFDDAVPVAKELLKQRIKNSTIKALLLRHLSTINAAAWPARHMQSQRVKPLNNRA